MRRTVFVDIVDRSTVFSCDPLNERKLRCHPRVERIPITRLQNRNLLVVELFTLIVRENAAPRVAAVSLRVRRPTAPYRIPTAAAKERRKNDRHCEGSQLPRAVLHHLFAPRGSLGCSDGFQLSRGGFFSSSVRLGSGGGGKGTRPY